MRKLRDQNEISEYFTKFFKNPYQRNTEKRIRNGQKNFFISFLSPEFLKDYSSLYDFYLRNLLMMIVQKKILSYFFFVSLHKGLSNWRDFLAFLHMKANINRYPDMCQFWLNFRPNLYPVLYLLGEKRTKTFLCVEHKNPCQW